MSLSVSESAQRLLTAPNSASRAASIDRKSSVDNESRCARSARSWLPSARLIAPNESELGRPAADGAAALAEPEFRSCSLSFRLSSLERSRSLRAAESDNCAALSSAASLRFSFRSTDSSLLSPAPDDALLTAALRAFEDPAAGDRTGDGALSAAAPPRALDLAPVAISAALCAASEGRGAAAEALLPGRVGLPKPSIWFFAERASLAELAIEAPLMDVSTEVRDISEHSEPSESSPSPTHFEITVTDRLGPLALFERGNKREGASRAPSFCSYPDAAGLRSGWSFLDSSYPGGPGRGC